MAKWLARKNARFRLRSHLTIEPFSHSTALPQPFIQPQKRPYMITVIDFRIPPKQLIFDERLQNTLIRHHIYDRLVYRLDLFQQLPMTTVGSYEAKTHLPELLARVEKGEEIVITRRGVPVALLTRHPRHGNNDIAKAIAQMKALRKSRKPGSGLSAEEIREMMHEGHRY